jgi:hypothetical protein
LIIKLLKAELMENYVNIHQRKFSPKLLLLLLPVIILLEPACEHAQNNINKKKVAAIEPTKMNVLYLGVDNPMTIAVSGYRTKDLRVELDSMGTISGENGFYTIRPLHPGILKVFVYAKKEIVAEKHFRVKILPDPAVKFAGKTGGDISLEELLKTEKIEVVMENFDFDVDFKILEFTLGVEAGGFVRSFTSKSREITKDQKHLLSRLTSGCCSILIYNVIVIGPDNRRREINSNFFTIK